MPVQPTWGQPARLEGSNCCQESRARSSETDREVGRAHKVLLPGKAQARRSFPHSSSIAESSLAVLLCDGGNVVVRNFGLAGLSARCCTSTLLWYAIISVFFESFFSSRRLGHLCKHHAATDRMLRRTSRTTARNFVVLSTRRMQRSRTK